MNPFHMFAYQNSMVADERRLAAYRQAISLVVRPGDVVIDLGAGTGVLSVMAAQAGAARVYAIDHFVQESMLRSVAERNGVSDRINIIRGQSTDVTLPEQGDVVIAEIGLDEKSLLDAKLRFLRPGGRMLPRIVSMCMAPVHAPAPYARLVDFWAEPHAGVDFSPVRSAASNAIHRVSLEHTELLASPKTLLTADMDSLVAGPLAGEATFVLQSNQLVHGLAAWHRIELVPGLWHDNPAPGPPESWGHNFLPFSTPLESTAGMTLHLSVVKRDQIWMWRGTCGPATFEQSTFANLPLDTGALKRIGQHA